MTLNFCSELLSVLMQSSTAVTVVVDVLCCTYTAITGSRTLLKTAH
jgi:hypothetical protein